ncbi:immunity 49 family protein [Streptomyces sp. NPDC060031]|uniref:immunity 49 family protein n=1 Tax=Streptomyces sp. NPDC060031 TaxID=3347043 RepID=UPI00368CCEE2
MTVTVARHIVPGPDAERFAERLSQGVAKRIDRLESSTDAIDFAFSTALQALQAHCVADPQAAKLETWEATVNAMQVGSALFAVTGASEGTVDCRINEKMQTLSAIGPQPFADAGNWLTAFWLAVICREQTRMTQLCEIPLERLRSPEGTYDEFVYHYVDVLQTYWLQRSGLVDKLIAAIETSNPAVAQTTPRDLLQGVLYPPINLFYHFVRKHEEGFSPALEEALKLHKAYWTLDEDREADIDGAVALGPLAMASLAYDGKLPIKVESDYLPKHLLEHGWLGEFPTY